MGSRRRGFALILVLVATSLVFALGVRAAANARSATVEAAALRRAASMERAARSATLLVLASLTAGEGVAADDAEADSTTNGETAAEESIEERGVPEMPPAMRQLLGELAGESEDPADAASKTTMKKPERRRRTLLEALRESGVSGAGVEVAALDRRVRVQFIDAAGLLNVNLATASELATLLVQTGVDRAAAERLADEIIDYRDEDDFVSPKGAEGPAYSRRELRIANADIKSLEELFFLPSMSRSIYERVEPYLTVVGNGLVHAPTAPRAVLASLDGMTSESVNRIIEARSAAGAGELAVAEALSPLSEDVAKKLSSRVSPYLRAYVAPVDGVGPVIRVDVAITSGGAVRFGYVGPAER